MSKVKNHERASDQTIMSISIPRVLKEKIKVAAEKEHRSMSSFVVYHVTKLIEELEQE